MTSLPPKPTLSPKVMTQPPKTTQNKNEEDKSATADPVTTHQKKPTEETYAKVKKYVNSPKYRDPEAWEFYQKAFASFWSVKEVDLASDMADWAKLTENEQYFIKQVLAFFAAADGIVAENCFMRFYQEFEDASIRSFYGFQIMIENVHNEMYSELIQAYVKGVDEQERLFEAVDTCPHVAQKAKWAEKWMESEEDLSIRLFAFACVEGLFFSGSFCAIFWLKKRGLMPGLTFSNELISRDEGMHCDFACLLYNRMSTRHTDAKIYAILDEAVKIEIDFVQKALPVSLIGMNADCMVQYIKFVADRLLVSINAEKMYHVTNPFDWMELISLQGKTNFFEKRVGEYQLPGVMTAKGGFSIDCDF